MPAMHSLTPKEQRFLKFCRQKHRHRWLLASALTLGGITLLLKFVPAVALSGGEAWPVGGALVAGVAMIVQSTNVLCDRKRELLLKLHDEGRENAEL